MPLPASPVRASDAPSAPPPAQPAEAPGKHSSKAAVPEKAAVRRVLARTKMFPLFVHQQEVLLVPGSWRPVNLDDWVQHQLSAGLVEVQES